MTTPVHHVRREPQPRLGALSPWGIIETLQHVCPGVLCVTTSTHGGYWIARALLPEIPAERRAYAARWSRGMGEQWYEEDCAAWAVVDAFADAFPVHMHAPARQMGAWIDGWRAREAQEAQHARH